MEKQIPFEVVAKLPVRVITIIYSILKWLFYFIYDHPFAFERAIAGILMVSLVYAITSIKRLSALQLSVLVPMSMISVEFGFLSIFEGDRLAYIYLTYMPLLSLLYLNVKGVFTVIILNVVLTSVLIFGFQVRLLGPASDLEAELNNFAGVLGLYMLYYFFARFSIRTIMDARRAAIAANKSKSKFLAAMSHEIRTPLNAIIGIAQVQLQKNHPPEVSMNFESIYGSGNSLLGIINDILDMTKIETGKLDYTPQNYDTPGMINDTVQLNIVRLGGSEKIEFILDIEPDLPSEVCGDELRVKQILNNLLSNAIKYTDSGFVKLSVRHEIQGANVVLHFMVEDSGQGIKPQNMPRLFTEYERFDSKRSTEGTGLGLVISKRLVEMMGGTISAESKFGKGSKFFVSVRHSYVECPPIGEKIAQKLRNFTYSKTRSCPLNLTEKTGRVLVVDDLQSNLYVAREMLGLFGIKMNGMISGKRVIDAIERGMKFDIIFMDHMMPEMDGIEVTKILREMGYTGTIIALTANAMLGDEKMFLSNGFDDFLTKPLDAASLNEILQKWL